MLIGTKCSPVGNAGCMCSPCVKAPILKLQKLGQSGTTCESCGLHDSGRGGGGAYWEAERGCCAGTQPSLRGGQKKGKGFS